MLRMCCRFRILAVSLSDTCHGYFHPFFLSVDKTVRISQETGMRRRQYLSASMRRLVPSLPKTNAERLADIHLGCAEQQQRPIRNHLCKPSTALRLCYRSGSSARMPPRYLDQAPHTRPKKKIFTRHGATSVSQSAFLKCPRYGQRR
jgi:hypothetical protein